MASLLEKYTLNNNSKGNGKSARGKKGAQTKREESLKPAAVPSSILSNMKAIVAKMHKIE